MAITIKLYQQRPPEVQAVKWDKVTDAAEIAAWCHGTYNAANGTIDIPDPIDQDSGYTARLNDWIMKTPEGRFMPTTGGVLPDGFTDKLV